MILSIRKSTYKKRPDRLHIRARPWRKGPLFKQVPGTFAIEVEHHPNRTLKLNSYVEPVKNEGTALEKRIFDLQFELDFMLECKVWAVTQDWVDNRREEINALVIRLAQFNEADASFIKKERRPLQGRFYKEETLPLPL